MKQVLILLFIAIAFNVSSQDVAFEIRPFGPTISSESIENAKTLKDVFPRFREDWMKEYLSVEIQTICNEEQVSIFGKNNTLTIEQLSILNQADASSRITLIVEYVPNNDLPREVKTYDEYVIVAPTKNAVFDEADPNGANYIQESLIANLSDEELKELHQMKIHFTVDAEGKVNESCFSEPSHVDALNKKMMEALYAINTWKPAKTASGNSVSQTLEFIVTKDLCSFKM